jgi:hypothetical protein
MCMIYKELFFMDNAVRPLSEMPNLSKRLNKGKQAQVRASYTPLALRPLRAKVTENPIQNQLQGYSFPGLPTEVQDVIVGAARNCSNGNKPLDVDCILACYQVLPEFHTKGISSLLDCSEHTARKYLQAIRMCNQLLKKLYL